ncbi:HPr family phosphocarrier protein [Brevibacillus sp. TJ4]|uniref:HPr family phosphocarrier protein n=1 Tax=Brevibacillus sp. TJ4 TaxID=3234853 RepID=UPI0037D57A63
MLEKKIIVQLEHGLHARPAATFVKKASSFASDIQLVKKEKTVNGKSIMGVMAAAIGKGEVVTLIADGVDEEEAIVELEKLLLQAEM